MSLIVHIILLRILQSEKVHFCFRNYRWSHNSVALILLGEWSPIQYPWIEYPTILISCLNRKRRKNYKAGSKFPCFIGRVKLKHALVYNALVDEGGKEVCVNTVPAVFGSMRVKGQMQMITISDVDRLLWNK